MNELRVIEALCRVIQELAALIRDEQAKSALLREVDAAMGEDTGQRPERRTT